MLIIITSTLFYQFGYSQQKLKDSLTNRNDYESGKYYLKQSKQQKTIGWVLFGAGATLMIVGSHKMANDLSSKSADGEVLALGGLLLSVASIPVFLSAAKNKGKAKILLSNQNIPLTHVSGTRLISVGVAVPLHK